MNKYVEYCETLVKGICSRPEEVKVTRTQDDRGILLTLSVARVDMPGLIGNKGQTATAVRWLVRIAAIRENARVSIKILEPVDSEQSGE